MKKEREILEILFKPLKEEVRSELSDSLRFLGTRFINFMKKHNCLVLCRKLAHTVHQSARFSSRKSRGRAGTTRLSLGLNRMVSVTTLP